MSNYLKAEPLNQFLFSGTVLKFENKEASWRSRQTSIRLKDAILILAILHNEVIVS